MDFNLDKDIVIFNSLFKKRPEIVLEKFKADLAGYYLPYIKRLLEIKQAKTNSDAVIVGICAIQGAGKTTQGEVLEILINFFGFSSDSISIDDHYITHEQLTKLKETDPRFIRRGVTHDITLAMENLKDLQCMTKGQILLSPQYDKGAHQGDGDRFAWVTIVPGVEMTAKMVNQKLHLEKVSFKGIDLKLPNNMGADLPLEEHLFNPELITFLKSQENMELFISMRDDGKICFSGSTKILVSFSDLPIGWRIVFSKPDFIFYDGWMLGARCVSDETIFNTGLPALETPEAQQFAKDINKKLLDYEPLWKMIEFMNVLHIPHYEMSLTWRENAEKPLREKGEGMTAEQIKEFVHYFWRSVHPAIQIRNLAHDSVNTQQVAIISDDHSIVEVLSPSQVAQKYP